MDEQLKSTVSGRMLQYVIYDPAETMSDNAPFSTWLDPGHFLLKRPHLARVNTIYYYHSSEVCTPACLHTEDRRLSSLNLNIKGDAKVWLIVLPYHKQKLEEYITTKWRTIKPKCSQFVRHQSMLLTPSALHQASIDLAVVEQGVGQLLYTEPDAYHQVLNAGCNVAMATNCQEDARGDGEPRGYKWCKKGQCGTKNDVPLSEKHFVEARP